MSTLHRGQNLAVGELKMSVRASAQRLSWALGAGAMTFVLLVYHFGPPNMVTGVIRYGWALLVRRFHATVPITGGVTKADVTEVARYAAQMEHHASAWVLFGVLGLIVAALIFGALSLYFWRASKRESLDKVTHGAQLLTPRMHNAAMRHIYRGERGKLGRILRLGVGGVIVPEAVQYLHFAFAGAPGGGKSTAISELIEQAVARGDKGLVVDLGGTFYAHFGRPGDRILSLRDRRSKKWDFWEEKKNGISEEAIAAAMIQQDTQGNTYFWKGARAVLASLLRHTSSTQELWEDFKKPTSDLRAKLAGADEISQRIMGDGDSDQADGIIGTTVLDFPFLRELNQWTRDDEETFSIARWINDPDDQSWTYILVTEDDLKTAQPLLRVWFDVACLAVLRRKQDSPKRHTWLIMDEVSTLGRLDSLPGLIDKGRKHKASVVLGFQNMSQFVDIYGDQNTKSMLQGLQNKVFFAMGEPAAANYASEVLGEHYVEQTSFGASFGTGDASDRGSYNRQLVRESVVRPEAVRSLQPLHAFVRLAYHQPLEIEFSITRRALINPLAKPERREDAKVPSPSSLALVAPSPPVEVESGVVAAPPTPDVTAAETDALSDALTSFLRGENLAERDGEDASFAFLRGEALS